MKNIQWFCALCLTITAYLASTSVVRAHPYASGITGTNGAGFVSFTMNEAGATVIVTFGDLTSTNLGVLPKGTTNFYLGTHSSFSISCYKLGTGLPTLISDDSFTNSAWTNGTGVAVNHNPKHGATFGRVYAGNSFLTPGTVPKAVGIYAMNADQTFVAFAGATNIPGTTNVWGMVANGNFKSPGRMRVAPNGKLLVADGRGAGNQNRVYMFEPDLSSAVALLGPSPSTGQGDLFGTPVVTGSLETGDLVLYTASAGEGAPGDTNCVLGPLTSPGSFNCVFRYNIGSGPLPWNKRPDYAYTVGLDGIAQLRPEVDVGPDGKIYAGFGRANFSNPNLQILRPAVTTNGITGDLINKDIAEAGKSATNWLYTSGVTPPFNNPPAVDPWNGSRGGNAGILGMYGGIRVSPDGRWFASLDNNNQLTVATLTNGIPDDGTIFGIQNGTAAGNQAGLDWDLANNLWVICRAALPTSTAAQSRLRCYSLGLTTTCVTSNDWTGTNGTFQLVLPPFNASVAVINPNASQNYVNNTVNPGAPNPGVFRVSLNTSDTTAVGPTFVGFVRAGTGGIIGTINPVLRGSNYVTAPNVTITGGGGSGATAVATLSSTGTVASVTVTSPGTGYTAAPTIGFTGGGGSNATATATLGLNFGQYTLNTNETPNGVTVTANGVIFPAGVFAGSNGPNWNVDVKVIPTQYPVSGPTYEFTVRLLSGTNYSASAPLAGSIALLNTGPQVLQLSAPAPATLAGMNRGIPNDYARFVITRLGDTNGPGNDAVSPIIGRTMTVTNIKHLAPVLGGANSIRGQAIFGVDYTVGAQNFTGVLPADGSPGISIAPGVVTIPAMIGNPVKHTDTGLTRSNLAVMISLTNSVAIGSPASTTNVLSSEGYGYSVTTATLTLNEFDNAVGGEVVLWSNPLTSASDSTNWTVVHAHISQDASPKLPNVISNYDNSASSPVSPGDFTVAFGDPVNNPNNDNGFVTVPQSPVMLANNWSNALRVTVNKNPGFAGESGVNLYPQIPGAPWTGSNFMRFGGNYALRFDMYLHLYDFGLNNPAIGTPAREFAAFGMNHFGTNANWRLDINPRADGTGAKPINADGAWCTIGAASGSITPADYDMFISPSWVIPILNESGVNTNRQPVPFTTNFFVGNNASAFQIAYTNAYQYSPGDYSGVTNVFNNAGVPNDQVSANNNAFGGSTQNGIIKTPPFSGINANGGAPANAWVDVSLELTRQTNLSLKVAQQEIFKQNLLLPTAGAQNPIAPFDGTPMLGYLDPNRDISDYSAFVYYSNIRIVELSPFVPWTNQPIAGLIVTQGASFSLTSGATFASNPLTNIWYAGTTNGAFGNISNANSGVVIVNRENGTPTASIGTNVFSATNGITTISVNNIQSGTNYISVWSDQAGSVTNYISVVEVIVGPGNKTVTIGNTATFTVVPSGNAPPTNYIWRFFGTNLVNGAQYSGVTTPTLTINNVTAADAGVYSCVITNVYGSVTALGTLTINDTFQPYAFTGVTNLATTVAMGFTTVDPADTASSFALQAAGVVTGPFTNYPFGIFSGLNPDFVVTVPKTNAMMYFRLKHN